MTMNNVLLWGNPKWIQQRQEIREHSTMVLLDRGKWSLFMWAVKHQHCQTSLKYDTAQQTRELYNCSLQCIWMFEACLHMLVTSPASWPEWKVTPRAFSFSFQTEMDKLRYTVPITVCAQSLRVKRFRKVPLRCFWISPWTGFHPPRSDDQTGGAAIWEACCHKRHGS